MTMLAQRTPVYDKDFLYDWKPLDSPVMGRHQTEVWTQGTGGVHLSDTIENGQPDLTNNWQQINSGECEDACNPPTVSVTYGTLRQSHYMEQMRLNSGLFCLTQLRYNTSPAEQIGRIMTGLKKLPELYTTDYLQVHAFDFAPLVQICSPGFPNFTPVRGTNVTGQLTTIDLGSSANLPTSQLTFKYMRYWTQSLGLEGYSQAGSGLPDGMYNLITDPDTWFNMTNGAPEQRDLMALQDVADASQLYKLSSGGVQKPWGNIAPTLNKTPIRFQLVPGGSGGVLNRVQPYYNVPATTGIMRVRNPAYLQARYQLSFIWHPMAIKLFTPDFKKMSDKVPTVNSAMFANWTLINNQGALLYTMPDGTQCTKDNVDQVWFYWRAAMELGFYYQYPNLMMPILHLVDTGFSSAVSSPVCGDAPQYVAQYTSDAPYVCTEA